MLVAIARLSLGYDLGEVECVSRHQHSTSPRSDKMALTRFLPTLDLSEVFFAAACVPLLSGFAARAALGGTLSRVWC
jgi:hypothetical protein